MPAENQTVQSGIKAQDIFQYYGVTRRTIIELPPGINFRDMPEIERSKACLIYQKFTDVFVTFIVYKRLAQATDPKTIRRGLERTINGQREFVYPEGCEYLPEQFMQVQAHANKFLMSFDYGPQSLRSLLEERLQKEIKQKAADLDVLAQFFIDSKNFIDPFNDPSAAPSAVAHEAKGETLNNYDAVLDAKEEK